MDSYTSRIIVLSLFIYVCVRERVGIYTLKEFRNDDNE